MNAPAPQSQQHPLVAFKQNLSSVMGAKDFALPSTVSQEAFKNAAIVAVQDNPAILKCTPATVMKSIRTIAAAGLVPDGREAAIVPFGGDAQAMPMVFGLIKMARRSGDVSDIRAHIVYQAELDQNRFEYVVGDEERLEHSPVLFGDKGEAVAAYAIAKLKDGTIVREFMDKEQIEKVRRSSPQQKKQENPAGIWQQWTEEMWKKTVIRRLCKRLDLSAEDMRRIQVEQDAPPPIRDITPEGEVNLAQRLKMAKDEAAEKPITGEIVDDDMDQTPPEDDLDQTPDDEKAPDIDKSALEFDEGIFAAKEGKPQKDCPYQAGTKRAHWLAGYEHQQKGTDK